jgi:hypothetical protein
VVVVVDPEVLTSELVVEEDCTREVLEEVGGRMVGADLGAAELLQAARATAMAAPHAALQILARVISPPSKFTQPAGACYLVRLRIERDSSQSNPRQRRIKWGLLPRASASD